MRKYWHILSLVVFVGFSSCKKDKTPFPLEPAYNDLEHGWYTEDCSNSWPDHWVDSFSTNGSFADDHIVFKVPQFNPNNPEEIVYYYLNHNENLRQLVKYSLKTTEKTILASGITILGEPAWGTNGWVAFSTLPSRILYKVKDDGTELTTFLNNISGIWPTWSAKEECLYCTNVESPSIRRLFKLCQMQNSLDTIVDYVDHYSLSSKKLISRSNLMLLKADILNSSYFAYANLNNPLFELTPIFDFVNSEIESTDHFCWSHDSQFIYLAYYATGDIYRVHVETGQIEQLRSDCYGWWLQSIDASPDGKYLVVEKVNLRFTILPDGTASSVVRVRSHITLIDLQTGQMKDLDLE